MPFVFTDVKTGAEYTTNSSAGTEIANSHYYMKPGTYRGAGIQAIYVIGKGGGLNVISGIALRTRVYATASTGGTAATKTPKDPGLSVAPSYTSFTDASAITKGSSATEGVLFGCGAAGPGGWVAPNPDSVQYIMGAATVGSMDIFSHSNTASLKFEMAVEVVQ